MEGKGNTIGDIQEKGGKRRCLLRKKPCTPGETIRERSIQLNRHRVVRSLSVHRCNPNYHAFSFFSIADYKKEKSIPTFVADA